MTRISRDVYNQQGEKIGTIEVTYDRGVFIRVEGKETQTLLLTPEEEVTLFDLMLLVRPAMKQA
jgi:hypothetical protein